MFKLDIEVCCKNYFELIHAIFLSLGSTKSVYFFGTPVYSTVRRILHQVRTKVCSSVGFGPTSYSSKNHFHCCYSETSNDHSHEDLLTSILDDAHS